MGTEGYILAEAMHCRYTNSPYRTGILSSTLFTCYLPLPVFNRAAFANLRHRMQVQSSLLCTRSTQPSIPSGSVNEYQLRLGRQRQEWLIPIADERVGVQVKL